MQPGLQIGAYRLEGTLGKGGMGAVYLARDPSGAQVALKVLHQFDPELLARFEREAKVLQALASPGVVRLLEFGLHERRPYLVQEYCSSGDLAEHLRVRGALPPEEASRLACQIAAALEAVHRAGIVHRDLKPANVLLQDGHPKVTDFGLARARGIDATSLTETGVLMGTPAYMAPEQLQDARTVDARTDVYALGVMLYEFLSGRRPFTGPTALAVASAVLAGHPPPLDPNVPSGLRAVVARAMQLDPAERYPSAEAMAQDLLALSSETPRATRSWALAVLGAAALGMAAVAFGPSLLEQPPPSPRPSTASSSPRPSEVALPSRTPTPTPTASAPKPAAPTPTASTATPQARGRAFADALQRCRDDPDRAERELEALADASHPGAREALIRLLLSRPKTKGKADELLDSAPPSPSLTLLRSRIDTRSDGATYASAALRELLPRALAEDGPEREVFDLAAVDAGLARSLEHLALNTQEPGARPLFRALLGRRPAWASDWLLAYARTPIYSRVRAALLSEVRAIPHLGRRRFLLARLQLDHPIDAYAFTPEEDPRRLLQAAAEAGYVPAAAELGRRLSDGSFAADPSLERRWLTVGAYGGVADCVGLLLKKESPRGLVEVGALLRDSESLYAKGKLAYEGARDLVRACAFWRLAAAQGNAKASLALGDALRQEDPPASQRHYRDAARGATLLYLTAFAASHTSSEDAKHKRTLLVGLAWAGSPEAGVRIGKLLEAQGRTEQARSFYRRAYEAKPKGPLREALAKTLARLAPPPGGPLEQAGQLELLAQAQAGQAPAIKELGRRANLECLEPLRLQRLWTAGRLDDPQCLIDVAQAHRGRNSQKVRAALGRAAELGRYDALAGLRDQRKKLRILARQGDPWASYGWSLVLLRQGRLEAGFAALRPALEAGLRPAHRVGLETEFDLLVKRGQRASQDLLDRAAARPAVLGAAFFHGRSVRRDLSKARTHYLEAALTGDVTKQDLLLMGRVVQSDSDDLAETLAQPWYQAAANLGSAGGALTGVQFLLAKPPRSQDWRRGWDTGQRLLRSLGKSAPPWVRLLLADAALHRGIAEREAALESLSEVPASEEARLAKVQLLLSLSQRERALDVFARTDPAGPVAPIDLFRKAEGVLKRASEGPPEEHVAALIASEDPNARLFLSQHLLGDLALGVEHPGEPALDEVIEQLLAEPRFDKDARAIRAQRERLR